MKTYRDLDDQDRAELLKFPALISLLASNSANGIAKKEKKAVVKLTHIRTFTCDPKMSVFYKEAENSFENIITDLDEKLPQDKELRKKAIISELKDLEPILSKLDPDYAKMFRKSMSSYKDHVSRSHHNVLEFFIFPIPIEGYSN